MSLQGILNEDWSPIDNRKRHDEKGFVSCEEVDEVEHLIDVFKKHYPFRSEKEIIYAIARCWRSVTGQQPRRQFVTRVASKL